MYYLKVKNGPYQARTDINYSKNSCTNHYTKGSKKIRREGDCAAYASFKIKKYIIKIIKHKI